MGTAGGESAVSIAPGRGRAREPAAPEPGDCAGVSPAPAGAPPSFRRGVLSLHRCRSPPFLPRKRPLTTPLQEPPFLVQGRPLPLRGRSPLLSTGASSPPARQEPPSFQMDVLAPSEAGAPFFPQGRPRPLRGRSAPSPVERPAPSGRAGGRASTTCVRVAGGDGQVGDAIGALLRILISAGLL